MKRPQNPTIWEGTSPYDQSPPSTATSCAAYLSQWVRQASPPLPPTSNSLPLSKTRTVSCPMIALNGNTTTTFTILVVNAGSVYSDVRKSGQNTDRSLARGCLHNRRTLLYAELSGQTARDRLSLAVHHHFSGVSLLHSSSELIGQ